MVCILAPKPVPGTGPDLYLGIAVNSSSNLYFIIYHLYFSAVQDVDEIILISDEKYAEELQLQEALIFSSESVIPSSSSPNQKASPIPSPTSTSSKKPLMTLPVATKPLRYSFCAICMDTKTASETFENANVCRHSYCLDCIRGHVAAKIKENVTKVKCPDPSCKGLIGPEVCRSIVPKEVLERWENILCESLINESLKFYCPFKDCSVMLVDDGGVTITSSECPNCHRLFCVQCKVAWHCGINCIEYQSLKKGEKSPNDILLTNLAKEKRWMKCPNCKLFVEKTSGCNHISCRCGHQFCYRCGKPDNGHGHICPSVI
ncbi:E3 ubiquitin-protein ligase RSL1-like [Bidens hawaiensis]|uniref:E3 ubiquitin-protein ligase RSL1-like n=1 Tax=Bidens hawaiensis TaxID=980011 RepID=UPI004049601E